MSQSIDLASLTLQDALDLAIVLEDESRQRYQEYAGIMGSRLATQTSGMFQAMAAREARHAAQLTARRRALFGDEPRRLPPEVLAEVEAPDARARHLFISPREAMEAALLSEERAHDFYATALPQVRDAEARALFAEIEAEEERHQAFLRELVKHLPDDGEQVGWEQETGSDPAG